MFNPLFPATSEPIKLYWFPLSGHAHRAQLMLFLLDIPHELITVDLANGAHKTDDFLEKHPFGQVPLLEDNGTVIWDSNAILVYLATKYDAERTWLPVDPLKATRVQQWLSVAAGPIFNGPCSARLVTLFNADLHHSKTLEITNRLYDVMEKHLEETSFLAGKTPTIADVAAYSYIAHSPEGGADLTPYPVLQKWLRTVEALPRFVGMKRTEVSDNVR